MFIFCFRPDHIVQELSVGCVDEPTIQAGFIGEIGITAPMTDWEKLSIRAAATGLPGATL